MRLRFAPLALVAALAACTPPDIKPQLSPIAPADLGLSGPVAPAIGADWWRAFGDPQLDRLVTDATAGSPTLQTALARVSQAQATLAARRADEGANATFDPQLTYNRLPGRYIIPPPYGGSERFVGQLGANLSYDLDLFGRQRAAVEEARASIAAARLDVEAARLALAGSVVQSYLSLWRAEQQIAIARETIATRQESLRLVNVRIRNKLASNLDAEAARTLLAQAQQALVRAEGARVLATNMLAALAGHGPDYAATIGKARLDLDAALPLPSVLPADLLARRADIAASVARIEAAQAGRQVARRAFYPNVNLLAMIGTQAIGLGNLLVPDSIAASVGPAVHLPIFDSGRLRAGLTGANAVVDLAMADYNRRVVQAVREAADAAALVGNLDEQAARQRDVVRGFSETGRLNAVRVRAGLDTRLDLIDNDIRLLTARQGAIDLAADAAGQRVALILALGGGYTPSEPNKGDQP
jgi:NodT family efflux transporter outer membrane factor (OMF) lipoprotein